MVPIMLYASERWSIEKKQEDKLTEAKMKHIRRIAEVTKLDRVRNIQIREGLQKINKETTGEEATEMVSAHIKWVRKHW